jgi:hypothetical protein
MVLPLTLTPAIGGKNTAYSCTVSVMKIGSPVTSFAVHTTTTATGGFLPRSVTDFLQSYESGILYDSSRLDLSVPHKSTRATVTIVVAANGPGAYTFDSTMGVVKGNGSFSQLARCKGTAAI